MKEKVMIIRDVEKGKTPPHLLPFTERFKKAVKECNQRQDIQKLKKGERIKAINECIGDKMRKKKSDGL